jgi:hypothetical protein
LKRSPEFFLVEVWEVPSSLNAIGIGKYRGLTRLIQNSQKGTHLIVNYTL